MATEENIRIGRNVRYLREKLLFSQVDICQYLGISQPAYVKYESGETPITMDSLEKIARLFNVEEYDILEGDSSSFQVTLACAYRKDGELTDLKPIADFQRIVKNYLMMSHELATAK